MIDPTIARESSEILFPVASLTRWPQLWLYLNSGGAILMFGLQLLLLGLAQIAFCCLLAAALRLVDLGAFTPILLFLFFGLGIIICAVGLITVLLTALSQAVLFLRLLGRRARNRHRLVVRGWPNGALTLDLLLFRECIWKRLPVYEDFLATGWCHRWFEGSVPPLNLFAALALLEELELEWRDAYDGRKTARERTDEIASRVLKRGAKPL